MKFISRNPDRKKRAVVHIRGDLQFPLIVVDVACTRLVVTCMFMWWSRSQRFLKGLDDSLFILDGVGTPWTVARKGNDGKHVPVISTEHTEAPVSVPELLEIYRSDCERKHRQPSDMSSVVTYRDFATMVLGDRGLAS